jgi:hypothetical protein
MKIRYPLTRTLSLTTGEREINLWDERQVQGEAIYHRGWKPLLQ